MAKPINLKSENTIPFTSQQLYLMRDMYLSGLSCKKVGLKFGICPQSVGSRLVSMGVKLRLGGGILKADRDISLRAFEMRKSGCSWIEVSDSTGCAARTLQEAFRRYKF